MSDKVKTEATPKAELKPTAPTLGNSTTLTLVVEDFRVRDGNILVRREDSTALDAYYLYPADNWQKTKTVTVAAAELARLRQPLSQIETLQAVVPTATDWQKQAWKVGLQGQKLPPREFEQACQQLVQRMLSRADVVRCWFADE
jgi:hypothetical protein